MSKIRFRLTTESNLFIGGTPTTFEIGGVDLYTVTDYTGYPIIPASSIKGALRNIVREIGDSDERAVKIGECYKAYLELIRVKDVRLTEDDEIKYNERFTNEISEASAQSLFGVKGFNNTPKLIFNDLTVEDKPKSPDSLFSIDSKNTISQSEKEISANPRTYKTVRPGVTFCGEILFYQLKKLEVKESEKEEGAEKVEDCVKELIEKALIEFNKGIYRLGNSGSRGYGRVRIDIPPECD